MRQSSCFRKVSILSSLSCVLLNIHFLLLKRRDLSVWRDDLQRHLPCHRRDAGSEVHPSRLNLLVDLKFFRFDTSASKRPESLAVEHAKSLGLPTEVVFKGSFLECGAFSLIQMWFKAC